MCPAMHRMQVTEKTWRGKSKQLKDTFLRELVLGQFSVIDRVQFPEALSVPACVKISKLVTPGNIPPPETGHMIKTRAVTGQNKYGAHLRGLAQCGYMSLPLAFQRKRGI